MGMTSLCLGNLFFGAGRDAKPEAVISGSRPGSPFERHRRRIIKLDFAPAGVM
jgi:hypothetical protein